MCVCVCLRGMSVQCLGDEESDGLEEETSDPEGHDASITCVIFTRRVQTTPPCLDSRSNCRLPSGLCDWPMLMWLPCSDWSRSLDEGRCEEQCSQGKYQSGGQCHLCDHTCATCLESGPANCTSCDTGEGHLSITPVNHTCQSHPPITLSARQS